MNKLSGSSSSSVSLEESSRSSDSDNDTNDNNDDDTNDADGGGVIGITCQQQHQCNTVVSDVSDVNDVQEAVRLKMNYCFNSKKKQTRKRTFGNSTLFSCNTTSTATTTSNSNSNSSNSSADTNDAMHVDNNDTNRNRNQQPLRQELQFQFQFQKDIPSKSKLQNRNDKQLEPPSTAISLPTIESSPPSPPPISALPTAIIQVSASRRKHRIKIVLGITLAVPILISLLVFYQGVALLLRYRTFFGNHAPIPFSPSHGLVVAVAVAVAVDVDMKKREGYMNDYYVKATTNTDINANDNLQTNNDFHNLNHNHNHNLNHTKPAHFQKYATNLLHNSYLHHTLQTQTPIRILIIGDSVACGVGQTKSCYPIMPETIGAILSKYTNRAVYWSVFGEPGATMKWIANRVNQHVGDDGSVGDDGGGGGEEEETLPSMQEFHSHSQHPAIRTLTVEQHQQEWMRKLHYHERLYDANPFAGYDYILALSGVNDIKRVMVPFLVYDNDGGYGYGDSGHGGGDSGGKNGRVRSKGFQGDLERLVRDFNMIAHFHEKRIDSDAGETLSSTSTCDTPTSASAATSASCSTEESNPNTTTHTHTHSNTKSVSKLPRIIFPSFPTRTVPAKTGTVLRWIAVKSTAILDGIKQHVANQDPEHLYAAPLPTDAETMDFLQGVSGSISTRTPESGSSEFTSESSISMPMSMSISESTSLLDILHEEEILLKLTTFDRKECQRLTEDMRAFYDARKAEQEENMVFSEFFSSDAIHPNDWGYDYFGRYLGKRIVQRWNVGADVDDDKGVDNGIINEGVDA